MTTKPLMKAILGFAGDSQFSAWAEEFPDIEFHLISGRIFIHWDIEECANSAYMDRIRHVAAICRARISTTAKPSGR